MALVKRLRGRETIAASAQSNGGFALRPDAGTVLFSARLRPHRSSSRRGRGRALALFALAQGSLGLAFAVAGAWPVSFFLALTWLGLVWAFARNARAARAHEDIELSALELHYARIAPTGARRDWRFSPLYVRLAVERHEEFGVERIDLCARRRRLEIGACLGRAEKGRLAQEFGEALARARQGPRFDNADRA
jgi:uncharacterized membrane protein